MSDPRVARRFGGRTRSAGLVLAATLIGLAVSGCAVNSPRALKGGEVPSLGYSQAAAEMEGLLASAQKTVGGEWATSDRGAEVCDLRGGGTGAWSPYGRLGPGVPDDKQEAILAAVSAVWTKAGYLPVRRVSVSKDVTIIELNYPETGYDVNGLYLSFWISPYSTSVEGQSQCVAGDPAEINRQYQRDHPRE